MSRYSDDESRLRVLSANLYADRLDLGGFRDLLTELEPDVALVQELSPEAADVLAGFLPHGLLAPEPGNDGRGLALIAPAGTDRLPMPHRDAQIARFRPPGWPAEVEFVNVHFANPIMWPVWRSLAMRRRQLVALMAHLELPRPRLVAGDFNASPIWPVYRRMAVRLTDTAERVAEQPGRRPAPTWGPTPWSPRLLRIDHVFVEGLRTLDTRIVTIPGSDHSGLVVDVAPA